MKQQLYIGIIGGREAGSSIRNLAFETGSLIAREGWTLVCGGRGGIMEEACRGARQEGGITLGILPGTSRQEGNPWLTHSIVTGLGEARNSVVVRSCNALIAVSGSFGTLSEIAFARLFNIPVIGLFTWNATTPALPEEQLLTAAAASAQEAIDQVKKYFPNSGR